MIPRPGKDRILAVLAAVVVLGLLVFIGRGKVSLDTNELLGTACAIPSRITAVPGAADSAPGGGGLRVVEQGAGTVVENTSAQFAYRIPVTAGSTRAEVPLLAPGQRTAVAGAGIVTFGPVVWLAPESLGGYTPITATPVPGGVRYTSANCRALTSRGGVVLQRGGETGRILRSEDLPAADVSCAPGEKVLPAVLEPHSEVYPYCALGTE
ncbi:hypothetical protein SAMN05421837_107743 [Amycolatopsis pretoriensis]|uniref:Uncharacterized protein n=1 Tax=Amycolatopsis pretoriensis TaxID=218821 RepID=A0A1H5RAL3_9PSEU|nr:hypothetical protein [Amycolatopsis pretoriensis]SEF35114.1 hypothetical protein SAMN05421837_107743 [Amycolatopsis pretoriensis]